jgi:hypothetical protein
MTESKMTATDWVRWALFSVLGASENTVENRFTDEWFAWAIAWINGKNRRAADALCMVHTWQMQQKILSPVEQHAEFLMAMARTSSAFAAMHLTSDITVDAYDHVRAQARFTAATIEMGGLLTRNQLLTLLEAAAYGEA